MTKVISLDTSSSATGWSLFIDGKYSKSGCINHKDIKNGKERMSTMCKDIMSLIDLHKPSAVYIETPVVVRNPNVQRMLTSIIGVVYGYCLEHGYYFEDLRPTEWRKYAKNENEKLPRKRTELKEWSKNRVYELLGKEVSDDESDAILIGIAALNKYKD